MARIVKEEEFTLRRNEILDVAQSLVFSKGYEQMTIHDILSYLQISKGAFYHYFDSKQTLLEALIERMLQDAEAHLAPIIEDSNLPAIQKLQQYFASAARWKAGQKEFLLVLLRVWYADDNAIVRQKVFATTTQHIAPLLTRIVHQGIQEGSLHTPYPDQAGEIVLSVMEGLGDAFMRTILHQKPPIIDTHQIEQSVAAYNDALEYVLGAPPGTLQLIDPETMKEWVGIINQAD